MRIAVGGRAGETPRVGLGCERIRDPGYGSTAKMISEAVICLSETARDKVGGGFWTPASAMGQRLIARLVENAGLTLGMVE